MEHDIVVTQKGRVLWIELNRPEARNAIRLGTMDAAIVAALREAAADHEVRAIVITGRGTAFCAGGDVKEMAKALAGGKPEPRAVREMIRAFHAMIEAIYECEKPVIAAVNGPAMGAGCNLALVCDVRIASERAAFAELFIHRGLTSDGGSTYLLPRLVGPAKAFELLALGETIDANEALRLGLVNTVTSHEEFLDSVEQAAARYAEAPPSAIALIKRGLRLGASATFHDTLEFEATTQALTMLGEEHAEGVQAFIEKRPPRF